jgi:uncharacterized protein (UPF0147 family)
MSKTSTKSKLETLQGWLVQLARENKNPRNIRKRAEK